MTPVAGLDEVMELCRDVHEVYEGGNPFLYLKDLRLPPGCDPAEVDALLCLHKRDGYESRLYLSERISHKGANWTIACILDRQWHTWSWQGVSPQQRPIQVLAAHMRALQ